jgi:hypothetical protein
MCQYRPANPTDPGDAADLSIMGYRVNRNGWLLPLPSDHPAATLAQDCIKINLLLTADTICAC